MVVANLNPFRGAEPDSGTVFELGYGFALGKKVWGYVANGEALLERVFRLEGQAAIDGEPSLTDVQGLMIENFGLPLNLMLAMSAHIVVGDLTACVAAIRPRHTPDPAVSKRQIQRDSCANEMAAGLSPQINSPESENSCEVL
jgi:nucleoside 2-deoxyribosyltransferase